jgi:NAD(P)-dependent dehydrogenase (short-subunit alcohol dehydrogenase family)
MRSSRAQSTGMYREMNDTADKQAFMTNLHALKRVAQPEELARSVLYLASDDSAFVTGTRLIGQRIFFYTTVAPKICYKLSWHMR